MILPSLNYARFRCPLRCTSRRREGSRTGGSPARSPDAEYARALELTGGSSPKNAAQPARRNLPCRRPRCAPTRRTFAAASQHRTSEHGRTTHRRNTGPGPEAPYSTSAPQPLPTTLQPTRLDEACAALLRPIPAELRALREIITPARACSLMARAGGCVRFRYLTLAVPAHPGQNGLHPPRSTAWRAVPRAPATPCRLPGGYWRPPRRGAGTELGRRGLATRSVDVAGYQEWLRPDHRTVPALVAALTRTCVLRSGDRVRWSAWATYSEPTPVCPTRQGRYRAAAENQIRLAGSVPTGRTGPADHPHGLRHTWASWHYATHRDPLLLRQEGGWSSLAVVERYPSCGRPVALEIDVWRSAGTMLPQGAVSHNNLLEKSVA